MQTYKKNIVIDTVKSGERMKDIMESHGLSVKDVQKILGISSHQSIYAWYSGKALPSLRHLNTLARVVNVSMDEFIVCEEIKYQE